MDYMTEAMTRRGFLKTAGLVTAGAVLAGCRVEAGGKKQEVDLEKGDLVCWHSLGVYSYDDDGSKRKIGNKRDQEGKGNVLRIVFFDNQLKKGGRERNCWVRVGYEDFEGDKVVAWHLAETLDRWQKDEEGEMNWIPVKWTPVKLEKK